MEKMKSLKSAVKFWQEIVFVVSIGYLLFEITKGLMNGHTDGWIIFLVCFFVPLFICLVGQFFWKSQVLAFILSPILGLSSFILILMALYALTTSPKIISSIIILNWGILLLVAAIRMPMKNHLEVKI